MKLYIIHHIKLFHCISCAKVLDINSGVIFNHFHLYTILSWRKNYTESYYTLLYTILSQRFLPNVSDISWMFIQHNVCNPKALKLCQIKGKKRYYPSFEWRNMTFHLTVSSPHSLWRTAGSEIFWTFWSHSVHVVIWLDSANHFPMK